MTARLHISGVLTRQARSMIGKDDTTVLELRLSGEANGLPIILRRVMPGGFASQAASANTAHLLRRGEAVTVELADGLVPSRSGRELVGRITHIDAAVLRQAARTEVA